MDREKSIISDNMRKKRKAKMRKKERMGLGKAFLSRSILIYLL
jgi:hypothetical protein